ncbi:MAG: alpha/beta fold hydrolase, partial [Thalassobaculaceae bacterium]
HGLARTGHDFAPLAAALAEDYWLIAPDTIGRGLSEWSRAPDSDYNFARYGDIAGDLLDHLGLDRVAWVGTSMGGSLGIYLAGGALRARIDRLVINDIGPELPAAAAERIATYVGAPPSFARVSELEAYFRLVYAPFGFIPEDQWRRMTESSVRRLPDGRITAHYDPAIVRQLQAVSADFTCWPEYDRIACPILILRGAQSDLLSAEMAAEMVARRPAARVVEIADCGHAPALTKDDQITPIADFLAQG